MFCGNTILRGCLYELFNPYTASYGKWFYHLHFSPEEIKAGILLTEAINHRQNVEKMAEEQKNKYLGLYTILPSELSLQLAEVALDLGTIHDQVNLQSRKSSFPFFIVSALLCDSAGFSVMSSWKQS